MVTFFSLHSFFLKLIISLTISKNCSILPKKTQWILEVKYDYCLAHLCLTSYFGTGTRMKTLYVGYIQPYIKDCGSKFGQSLMQIKHDHVIVPIQCKFLIVLIWIIFFMPIRQDGWCIIKHVK
jgi:hypothetical protein